MDQPLSCTKRASSCGCCVPRRRTLCRNSLTWTSHESPAWQQQVGLVVRTARALRCRLISGLYGVLGRGGEPCRPRRLYFTCLCISWGPLVQCLGLLNRYSHLLELFEPPTYASWRGPSTGPPLPLSVFSVESPACFQDTLPPTSLLISNCLSIFLSVLLLQRFSFVIAKQPSSGLVRNQPGERLPIRANRPSTCYHRLTPNG